MDSDDGILKSLRTQITFVPSYEDNLANISCEAVHPALDEMEVVMSSTVTLDVHCQYIKELQANLQ